jgi:hypothetical protein
VVNFEFGADALATIAGWHFSDLGPLPDTDASRVGPDNFFFPAAVAARRAEEARRQQACADAIQQALANASSVEIFSVDPTWWTSEEAKNRDPRPKLENRWPIDGTSTVTSPDEIKKLAAALASGIREHGVNDGVMGCFNPRHGFRWIVDGKPVTLIVCYECLQGTVSGLAGGSWFLTTRSPEGAIDQIFSSHGLKKAN